MKLNAINTKINFCQTKKEIEIPSFVQQKTPRKQPTQTNDYYTPTKKTNTSKERPRRSTKKYAPKTPIEKFKKSKIGKFLSPFQIKSFIVGLTAMGAACGFGNVVEDKIIEIQETPKIVRVTCENEESLDEIADTFNINVEDLKAYNNIKPSTIYDENTKIIVPFEYDLAQDAIDELINDIKTTKYNEKELEEKLNELEYLRELQKVQNQIANVYTDGEKIVFIIKENLNKLPKEINPKSSYCLNIERFKSVFGIKDKALKSNNYFANVNYNSEIDAYDYSGIAIYSGDIIKIGLNDYNIKNASLKEINPDNAKKYKY